MGLHQTKAQYQPLLQAWRPVCLCGWVGELVDAMPSPQVTSPLAAAYAEGHVHTMFAEQAIDWSILQSWLEGEP